MAFHFRFQHEMQTSWLYVERIQSEQSSFSHPKAKLSPIRIWIICVQNKRNNEFIYIITLFVCKLSKYFVDKFFFSSQLSKKESAIFSLVRDDFIVTFVCFANLFTFQWFRLFAYCLSRNKLPDWVTSIAKDK